MYLPTATEAAFIVAAAMLMIAIAGWLAGTAAYYASTLRRARIKVVAPSMLAVCLLTLACYAVIFMPLFKEHGAWDTVTALVFIGMHVVPFLALGAYCAWFFQKRRRLRNEKLLAAWISITELRRPARETPTDRQRGLR